MAHSGMPRTLSPVSGRKSIFSGVTAPSPAPPAPPPRDLTKWIAFGAGVAAVLVGVVVMLLLDRFGGDDIGDSTTTTTVVSGDTTTVPEATTTVPGGDTTTLPPADACTGPNAVIRDRFRAEDPVCSFPAFGDIVGGVTHVAGRGEVTTFEGNFFIAWYPQGPVGDATITLEVRPLRADPNDAFGVVFLASDPPQVPSTSFNPPRYVRVSIVPASAEMVAYAWDDGPGLTQVEPIPPAANLDPTGWNTLEIVVAGGGFTASLNGVPVMTWVQPLPGTEGYVGLGIGGNAGGSYAMRVDDLTVRVP